MHRGFERVQGAAVARGPCSPADMHLVKTISSPVKRLSSGWTSST